MRETPRRAASQEFTFLDLVCRINKLKEFSSVKSLRSDSVTYSLSFSSRMNEVEGLWAEPQSSV